MGKPRLRSQTAAQARAAAAIPTTPAFTHTLEGPLLVLLFSSKPAQLDALARIETYYEGNVDKRAGEAYLSWEVVKGSGACANYTAFNFTVRAVREWLGLMWRELEGRGGLAPAEAVEGRQESEQALPKREGGEEVDKSEVAPEPPDAVEDKEKDWWEDECSVQERHLLRLLKSLGCLDALPFAPHNAAPRPDASATASPPESAAEAHPIPATAPPTYLISALASQSSDLTHERLHALFHLSPSYASTSADLFDSLSPKVRAAVEWDLAARGYRREMYADEWQAYVSEDAGEFGGKAKAECEGLRPALRRAQEKAREELGLR
ncbi:enhancer of mRNA decapping [Tilletia horrida]|nr:enhancer of mRNA decapping [Tilletia horrida]